MVEQDLSDKTPAGGGCQINFSSVGTLKGLEDLATTMQVFGVVGRASA